MKSVWEQTGEHRDFAPLKGDISTDVLIIGGGMAGICAPICCTAPEYPMF